MAVTFPVFLAEYQLRYSDWLKLRAQRLTARKSSQSLAGKKIKLNVTSIRFRILVMEDGQVKEFASPEQLLSDPRSVFYGMAKAAGLV